MSKRSCGDCTKCCEGWLAGNALGHSFYKGKPCHFISIGKGCSVYEDRPKDPCQSYKCGWLESEEIPEWMKPNEINAIIDIRNEDGIEYICVTETGQKLDSKVLSWLFLYAVSKGKNIYYEIDGGHNYYGNLDFVELMKSKNK